MPNVGATPTGNIFLDTFDQAINPNDVSPTSQINGSGAGTSAPIGVSDPNAPTNAARADALFPFFDGVNEKLSSNPVSQDGLTEYLFPGTSPSLTPAVDANGKPLPLGQLFENAIPIPSDPNNLPVLDFFGFHSSHQIEYVLQFGDPVPGQVGARVVTFIQNGNRFDIVAIPGERQIFVLQQLTKADLAIASFEIERALSEAVFTLPSSLQAQITNALGASNSDATIDAFDALTTQAMAQIEGFFETPGTGGFSDEQRRDFKGVFIDQIDNINLRLSESRFFAVDEIRTRINEIVRRAERANQFFIVVQNPPISFRGGEALNVNAPVGADLSQSGIADGFNAFIAQETRLRDLDNQRLQLARTGLLSGGRALDGPNIIAIFQLNYNLTREAEVNAETEELNQQNGLLRVYAAVQQLVNDALREFATGEDGAEEERTITGSTSDNVTLESLSDEDQNLIAFIDEFMVGRSQVGHPIEALRNINRPTLDVVDFTNQNEPQKKLNKFSQNALSIFASQLADTVTQINQESQILTNEISSVNRERNRHFDLANNALRRLNDALLTIARA